MAVFCGGVSRRAAQTEAVAQPETEAEIEAEMEVSEGRPGVSVAGGGPAPAY